MDRTAKGVIIGDFCTGRSKQGNSFLQPIVGWVSRIKIAGIAGWCVDLGWNGRLERLLAACNERNNQPLIRDVNDLITIEQDKTYLFATRLSYSPENRDRVEGSRAAIRRQCEWQALRRISV